MKVLFTGTRRMNDSSLLKLAISELPECEHQTWVHGDGPGSDGAPGCDQLVELIAESLGVEPPIKFPADWNNFGSSAGPIRNTAMVKSGADICLAFPDKESKGTWDCLRKAVAAGIPTRIYPVLSP